MSQVNANNQQSVAQEVQDTYTESSGFAAIGIDSGLLIAQIINFLLILLVLRIFLYKPIVKILEERRQKIEESIKLAEKTRLDALAGQSKIDVMLKKARLDAQEIVEGATKQAQEVAAQIKRKAQLDVEQLNQKTRELLRQEKDLILQSARRDLGILIVNATKKIIADRNLELEQSEINRAISSLGDQK